MMPTDRPFHDQLTEFVATHPAPDWGWLARTLGPEDYRETEDDTHLVHLHYGPILDKQGFLRGFEISSVARGPSLDTAFARAVEFLRKAAN